MGKRSDFDRIPKDLYQTWDPKAVTPLLPHLPARTKFAEPCCGEMALIRQLEAAGHVCYWASDIVDRNAPITVSGAWVKNTVTEIDALKVTKPLQLADCIITNPPYLKEILFPMIEHFRKYNQTWLLLSADFMHNVGSGTIMKYCSKIVSIGRVTWIPGTKPGKENSAWYCFEQEMCETKFIGRQEKSSARAKPVLRSGAGLDTFPGVSL